MGDKKIVPLVVLAFLACGAAWFFSWSSFEELNDNGSTRGSFRLTLFGFRYCYHVGGVRVCYSAGSYRNLFNDPAGRIVADECRVKSLGMAYLLGAAMVLQFVAVVVGGRMKRAKADHRLPLVLSGALWASWCLCLSVCVGWHLTCAADVREYLPTQPFLVRFQHSYSMVCISVAVVLCFLAALLSTRSSSSSPSQQSLLTHTIVVQPQPQPQPQLQPQAHPQPMYNPARGEGQPTPQYNFTASAPTYDPQMQHAQQQPQSGAYISEEVHMDSSFSQHKARVGVVVASVLVAVLAAVIALVPNYSTLILPPQPAPPIPLTDTVTSSSVRVRFAGVDGDNRYTLAYTIAAYAIDDAEYRDEGRRMYIGNAALTPDPDQDAYYRADMRALQSSTLYEFTVSAQYEELAHSQSLESEPSQRVQTLVGSPAGHAVASLPLTLSLACGALLFVTQA